jgi:hypothetical protein
VPISARVRHPDQLTHRAQSVSYYPRLSATAQIVGNGVRASRASVRQFCEAHWQSERGGSLDATIGPAGCHLDSLAMDGVLNSMGTKKDKDNTD